ncbi:amino acid adenylation domain-containing protein [Plantactinospora sp. WMMC1484]|uniref:amino acid adenylation domain-containing protein n=1 Tax=Plantactinospora sp. WMMC1484 TaxID=3404122 RepID=UPI003BF5A446
MTPLSFGQQRLWFQDRLEGAGGSNNVTIPLRLRGELDLEVLQEALVDLLERHAILRTVFPESDGIPYQSVLEPRRAAGRLPVIPVEADDLYPALSKVCRQRFDLSSEPPIRAWLFSVDDDDHVLMVVIHHIAVDGWSTSIIERDLGVAYAARREGDPPRWPGLPVSYADFAVWQRTLLDAEEEPGSLVARQLDFWRRALADLPEVIQLPTDRPRPAESSYEGGGVLVTISAPVHAALADLARASKCTMFMVVQAALAALLTRLGAGTDIPIGSPVGGRAATLGRAGGPLYDLVGFFVNTLVLRTDTGGAPTFRELLRRVREADLAAFAHQDVPFERLVEVLNPPRSLARHPLFQVMFAFERRGGGSDTVWELPELTAYREPFESSVVGVDTKFDLALELEERRDDGKPAGLRGNLTYSTDLFDLSTAKSISGRLARLLEAVATDPDLPIADIDLLTPRERRQVLGGWAGKQTPQSPLTLADIFERQVEQTPEHTAIVADGVALTYTELNRRANRLAHRLVAQGAGPESAVAIVAPRSIELMVGIYGILKTGAAYLPIDDEFPPDRVATIVHDARASIVLTREAVAEITDGPDENPAREMSPESPAYILYTSGSTGRPKGVTVPHHGAVNTLAWLQRIQPLRPSDKVLLKTSISFDVSLFELFWPLQVGATLVLAAPQGHRDAAYLVRTVIEQEITVLYLSPSMLSVFLAEEQVAACRSLRLLLTGGEILPRPVQDRCLALFGIPLVNVYGPTEASIVATAWECRAEFDDRAVSIGTPVDNTGCLVLDERLQPVPVSVTGQLFLTGVGLARGYLHAPAMTAERFVACPFGPPGTRMYRTGDLARWRRDGTLDFIGRTDGQVKIRGYRIELGEIEAVLAGCPGVAHAAVVVRTDRGEKRLAAYVSPGDLDVAQLRRAVAKALPDYMVPSSFTILPALPFTASGKIDRRSLPAPQTRLTSGRAAATPSEQILAELFAEVLGVAAVGVDDDFFELGGHSLLAIRLVARIRSVLGADVAIRELFAAPTVARLATGLSPGGARSVVTPRPRPAELPLAFAQQRLWFLHQMDGPNPVYNIFWEMRVRGDLDRDALHTALRDVITRHEALRTVFPDLAGRPRQHLLTPEQALPVLPYWEVDEQGLAAKQNEYAQSTFDLAVDPPARLVLFRTGPDEHVLMMVVHHIAFDGWSTGPFERDLGTAYAARVAGRAPAWTPLPVQYADFALWQRDFLAGEDDPTSTIAQQMAYWKQTLAGAPELIDLPLDRPRPEVQSYRGDGVHLPIGPDVHRRMVALARENGCTMFMLLHATFAALLTRMGAGTDIVFGTPTAGRSDEALHDMIGFFVNNLVLRTDTSGGPSFRELLRRVREIDLAAVAHADVPFERLVEVINPSRSLARHPLFQVMIVLEHRDMTPRSLAGLVGVGSPDGERIEGGTAKFDLALQVQERRSPDGSPASLMINFEYAVDLFDRATIEALAERFLRLLTFAVERPDVSILDLPVLSDAEHDAAVAGALVAAAPLTGDLVSGIEEQVARTPGAIAVIAEGETLTYAQLDERATCLARHLLGAGARPGTIVAVVMSHSADLAVAAYGVAKTGAAYLPLDASFPTARIEEILSSAHPVAVVTPRLLAEIDAADATAAYARPSGSPADPAYVIYTSGSTGRPKGVVVSQAAIANTLDWLQRICPLGSADRMLQVASAAFDASIFELFWPLRTGAAVVFASAEGYRDPEYLAALVERTAATAVFLAPPMWSALLEVPGVAESCASLRYLLTGAEALPRPVAERALSTLNLPLINLYGPTEAAIVSTAWRCVSGEGPVPIGTPIDGTGCLVLDERLRPVPPGVPGHLWLTGAGLAHGYLHAPAQTAERFVAGPYGPPGSRMYRTGDVVKRRADATLDFLGRTDDQVKVRGYRIELGEVAALLAALDGVVDATVVVREDQADDRRLYAYAVPATLDPVELRRALARTLPDYMVPASITLLDALPLTPSGKVDRAALPMPDAPRPGFGRAPQTAQEEAVSELFAEVLGAPTVSAEDDFFALGGHSLLAARLVARIREALGGDLALRDLFATPTVEGVAAKVASSARSAPGRLDTSPMLAIRASGGAPPLFCFPPYGGMAWVYERLTDHLGPDRPLYALQSPAAARLAEVDDLLREIAADFLDHVSWLHAADVAAGTASGEDGFESDVAEHVERIRAVQGSGPYHLLGWALGGAVAHAVAARLQADGDQVAFLGLLDAPPAGRSGPVPAGDRGAADMARRRANLATVPADLLDEMADRVRSATARIVAGHQPIFAGPVLYLAATGNPVVDPSVWQAHVDGELVVHTVNCDHLQMLSPAPVGVVGPIVAAALAAASSREEVPR